MSAAIIQWPPAPAELQLAGREIHLFAAPLDVSATALAKHAATLSLEEKDRAGKFRFDRHRSRFIAGRGLLRGVLARYLQTLSAKLDFTYTERGKPDLAAPLVKRGFHFNLAHSEDLALLAVTRLGPVGVDVEHLRPINHVDHLVARFFSPRENELFQKLPAAAKPPAFFRLWTRKEAWLKATGEGIGSSLNKVEVSFLPGEPAKLLAISGDSEKASSWSLRELSPADGFIGALAIQAKPALVQSFAWAAD